MIPWLSDLFTNRSAFVRLSRSGLLLAGMLASNGGDLTDPGAWLVASGGLLRAGQNNHEM